MEDFMSSQNHAAAGSLEPVRIEQKDAMILVGIAERTTNMQEITEQAVIPKLWSRYYEQGINTLIPDQTEPGVTYGCYCDYVDGAMGEYTILVGVQVNSDQSMPEGVKVIKAPAAKYAVFTTRRGPMSTVVAEAWQSIWQWSMTSGYERTYTGDFEVYDRIRCADINDVEVDIYIAIK
ncbi:GyrI-like domain-containing protein [Paenibacillus albiflavus]|nr:GyrI-like domain-containing protein [Paenibacillus albiflavus]